MIDTATERTFQTRLEQLRRQHRTSKDVIAELFAVGALMRTAKSEAEREILNDKWNLLRGEAARFQRKANRAFCKKHPELSQP